MKVEIINETREYDGFFKIDKAILRYEKFNGEMSDEVTRLNFNRGNSVGILLFNESKNTIILVNQFRYPAYVNNGPGWILEIVAGMLDDRDVVSVAKSEVLEEAGYEIGEINFISKFYPSPGGSSEIIYLYWGRVQEKVGPGGGKVSENEDIQVVELPIEDAFKMIETGEICDAKTIIAIQWLYHFKCKMAQESSPTSI